MKENICNTHALLNWVKHHQINCLDNYVPFSIDGIRLGMIAKQRLALFRAYPDFFQVSEQMVALHPRLDNPQTRTDELHALLEKWYRQGVFGWWGNEPYRVATNFHSDPLMLMERGATSLFGICKYGVHVNGITRRNGETRMWIGQRSRHDLNYPKHFDQFVAGGLGAGYTPLEVTIKECEEEAGVPAELAKHAQPVSVISYCMEYKSNLSRHVLFIYDLELPEDFEPQNTDGEVEAFHLWRIPEIARRVADTQDFKPNTNLVVIDYLIRHAYLSPEDPCYTELAQGMRQTCLL